MTEKIGTAIGEQYAKIEHFAVAGQGITIQPAAGYEYIILSIACDVGSLLASITDGALYALVPLSATGQLERPIVVSNTVYLTVYTSSGTAAHNVAASGIVSKVP